jgi:hypothetical protein
MDERCAYKSAIREVDPATGAPWTKVVNAAEFGMEVA